MIEYLAWAVYSEFQASLSYIARPCPKNKQTNKIGRGVGREEEVEVELSYQGELKAYKKFQVKCYRNTTY
jgi:hypothetical protein